jgi:hypothetical protein
MGLRRDEWEKCSTGYIARKMSPRVLEPLVNQDEIRGELASHLAGGPRPPAEGREGRRGSSRPRPGYRA